MKRTKTRKSVRGRFFALFLLTCAGTIALCLLALNLLFEPYSVHVKEQSLYETAAMLNAAADDDSLYTDAFAEQVNEMAERNNIRLIVLDEDATLVRAAAPDAEQLGRRLWERLIDADASSFPKDGERIILETERAASGDGYIEAFGFLNNGNVFLMQTPLSGIRDSVRLANRFMLAVGGIAVLIGALVAWYSSYWAGIFELEDRNRRLEEDLEAGRRLEAERRSFLSDVTHELKTPIALIRGYAEGLRDGVCDETRGREEYLSVILDETEKMNRMVKELTALNQLESGADAYTPGVFDLSAMVQNFLKSADILTKSSHASVRFSGEDGVMVYADEYRTEEMLQNYFNNALQHLSGERVIEVRLSGTDAGKVRVSVFNTGDPVPEDSLPHLFEKFYKADPARARDYGGSGIGLAIVKAIQEQANEAYGVENFDNGVLFWFDVCPAGAQTARGEA
ncbi:MAG: hypothetical protein IJQ21_11165 [Lachnospiraceae bacterium]|nr:hypothetical protein [Lachnospiraceae bacterium]